MRHATLAVWMLAALGPGLTGCATVPPATANAAWTEGVRFTPMSGAEKAVQGLMAGGESLLQHDRVELPPDRRGVHFLVR